MRFEYKQKYSSGRRGAPAKGIGRETGARVQIPPSAFSFFLTKKNENKSKKLLTTDFDYDNITKLSLITKTATI